MKFNDAMLNILAIFINKTKRVFKYSPAFIACIYFSTSWLPIFFFGDVFRVVQNVWIGTVDFLTVRQVEQGKGNLADHSKAVESYLQAHSIASSK